MSTVPKREAHDVDKTESAADRKFLRAVLGSDPQNAQPFVAVWLPGSIGKEVLAALRERALYQSPLSNGVHQIICPWAQAHSDPVDDRAEYFEPDSNRPIGGFKCWNRHCADRHIQDLLQVLSVDLGAVRVKPIIRVIPGEIDRVVDAAERELAQSRRLFQSGGQIVAPTINPSTGETCVQPISTPALMRELGRVALWEQFDARKKTWVRTDPPSRHVTVLSDASQYPHLPVLKGLTRQPFLRSDGSLANVAGYDLKTGLFGAFDPREYSVSDRPTTTDAKEAFATLRDLLSEFDFPTESDRAAALSAMLTAAIRPSLALAPMFHIQAHVAGAGKSYLCQLVTAFASPRRGTPTNFPSNENECCKLLLAQLLTAPAVIEFDNLTSDLIGHTSLCTALTSEFLTERILGVSKTATVSTRTLFLSSGNNVGAVEDMSRRCITIRLSPELEMPAARTFARPDLVQDVLRERGHFVSAALTIIRAWVAAGRPETVCQSLAGYHEWSGLCRQPLLWLGCDDPAASVFKSMSKDPHREMLLRIMQAWYAAFGERPTMVREALGHRNNPELREVLEDIAGDRGEINRRKLGWWLRRHEGRIVEGMRFARGTDGKTPAEQWRVELVSSVS